MAIGSLKMRETPMRVGVAGAGHIGSMHASNLATLDDVDQVLLFDPVAGRAAEVLIFREESDGGPR